MHKNTNISDNENYYRNRYDECEKDLKSKHTLDLHENWLRVVACFRTLLQNTLYLHTKK